MTNAIAFLDRDGVINVDKSYVYKTTELEFVPGAIFGLQKLLEKNFKLVVVTNQSGIGRGYFTENDYQLFMTNLQSELGKFDINFLHVFHCPHHPIDNCSCRKPKIGMVYPLQGACYHKSIMIGDKESDYLFAKNLGVKRFYHLSNSYLPYEDLCEKYVHVQCWDQLYRIMDAEMFVSN